MEIGGYEVIGELGRGGMGVVHLARQHSLDRLVALKILPVDEPTMADRLEQEARRLADLRHPNIVTVIDVGRHDGRPWFAMTYCPGGTLSAVLERDGRLLPGQAAGALASVAEALSAVHSHGLVHRDIKPSNVLLSERGEPYLGDLGIATDGASDRPTATNAVLGTIGYTAPEIIEGGVPTPAADVFGLGVLGYQLLAGAPPYAGAHIAAVIDAIRSGRRRPLAEAAPDAPAELVALVEAALANDPTERPADLVGWARQVRDAARPEPIEPVRAPEITGATVSSVRRRPSTDDGTTQDRRTRRPRVLLAVAGIAVVALVAALVTIRPDGGGDAAGSLGESAAATKSLQENLPVRQGADGVVVAERWTVHDGTLTSQIVAKNTTAAEVTHQLDVLVPKEIAENVGDVRWKTMYTSVVQADPIVRYCIGLPAGQQQELGWSAEVGADAEAGDLAGWVKAWEGAVQAHMTAPAGEPCPGAAPTEIQLTDSDSAEGSALTSDLAFSPAPGLTAAPSSGGGMAAPARGSDDGASGSTTAAPSSGGQAPSTESASGPVADAGEDSSTATTPTSGPATSGGTTSTGGDDGGSGSTSGGTTSGGSTGGGTAAPPPPPQPDACPYGDHSGSAYDGGCGNDPCPYGDHSGNGYDGSCGVDPCQGGDYSGSTYDGACGNAPPVVYNDTGPSIGFGSSESGTKCAAAWNPLAVNPLNNDTDREGDSKTAVWNRAYDSNGDSLALGGSIIKGFNSAGNPTICLTRSYVTGLRSPKAIYIEYRARDSFGNLSGNVATITIPVFAQ